MKANNYEKLSGLGHSAVLLRTLPLSGSLNRGICGSLLLAQISQSETSHIPGTLSEIAGERFKKCKNIVDKRRK